MTSLGEAYGTAGKGNPGRLYAGVGLFLVGAALVSVGIVAAGTDVLLSRGYTLGEVRELGGILGGIGVPAVFLGILSVLPSSRRNRAAAVIGACVSLLGVVLFQYAYPCRWIGSTCDVAAADLTLPTVGVYFLGALTTFWCLFVGVATFKTRNDPGGTARLDVIKKGETRIVEVDRSRGFGGVGFLGGTPDGEVETQTNGRTSKPVGGVSAATGGGGGGRAMTSDGGATTRDLRSPLDDEPTGPGAGPAAGPDAGDGASPDTYCGNCAHFDYVRTDAGIQPYCGHHDELMDDMDPCPSWTDRR